MIEFPVAPRDLTGTPFLRWVGGKGRLLPVLRAALPRGKRLIEPFAGSGAVFLGTRYDRHLLGDANHDLINLFQWVQRDLGRFLKFSRPLFLGNFPDEETYRRTRNAFNACHTGTLERAILFLWLNKTAFNGVCRYNAKGEFNVPKGDGEGPLILPEGELTLFHRKSAIATFRHGDFREVMAEAEAGDVVYCDPPYVPRSTTASFTAYAQDGFREQDHVDLAEACRQAAARGATVVLSNSDTPATRALYGGGLIVSAQLCHTVGASGDSRGHAGEALILFGDPGDNEFWTMAKPIAQASAPRARPRREADSPGAADETCYPLFR